MKLGLGTAQFGIDYGISNTEGKCSLKEVERILEKASEIGATILDTGPFYGTSEDVLGSTINLNRNINVVTKITKFFNEEISDDSSMEIERVFFMSLKRMKRKDVYGLLVHECDNLFIKRGDRIFNKMVELKERGLIKKIGVSVYSKRQIDLVLERYSFDLIQIPINVLDQRLIKNGSLSRIKDAGLEIHARSIFLQGLLLLKPETLPPFFDEIKEHLCNYHLFIKKKNISPVLAAISFIKEIKEIDVVLCGVNNVQHLEEINSCFSKPEKIDRWEQYAINNDTFLNPSNWRNMEMSN